MPAIPTLPLPVLQKLCDVLGDTATGLTGSDIGRHLARAGIDDPLPAHTKRYRLFEALAACQRRDGCANNVLAFVATVMAPVNYVGSSQLFEDRRAAVNEALAFAGLSIGVDGQLSTRAVAKTLSEAEQRARSLRNELLRRGAHAEVLRFCRAELLQDNYFHAVLEAAKSLAERLRQMTGVEADGARLVDQVLEPGSTGGLPLVAFNSLATETDRSEHRGLTFMVRGVFSAFRNPTAHEPKISLLHRKLDAAVLTRAWPDL